MTSPDPFPSEGRVRLVGVGRKVTGAVPSLSCPASQIPQCCYNIRDGGAVTEVSGWDPGHIHRGSGGLTLLSFEPWQSGRLSMPSYGERLGGGAICPLCGDTASSEAENESPLEGRSATLERGGGALRDRGS